MKTQFKDVAHLYVGSKVLRPDNRTILNIYGIQNSIIIHLEEDKLSYSGIDGCRPILIPVSSITREQAISLCEVYNPLPFSEHRKKHWVLSEESKLNFVDLKNPKNEYHFCIDCKNGDVTVYKDDELHTTDNIAELVFWFTKNHFDLFGLIESGQAIDATTLPDNPYK